MPPCPRNSGARWWTGSRGGAGPLLLAEAFWMLEGYFVRTLGMHRVYNSAFMHMLRDEDNAGYGRVPRRTLWSWTRRSSSGKSLHERPRTRRPPSSSSARATSTSAWPRSWPPSPVSRCSATASSRASRRSTGWSSAGRRRTSTPTSGWSPVTSARSCRCSTTARTSAEAQDFLLYDFAHDAGGTDENVFAYSNGSGAARSVVVYHNRYGETAGWIRDSAAYAVKDEDGSKRLERRTLAEGLGLADGAADDRWIAFREQRTSLEYLRSVAEVREHGLHVQLHAYDTRVFWELRELHDSAHIWRRLAERLGGMGVPSLEDALREQQLGPVHDAVQGRHPRAGAGHRRAARRRRGRCDRDGRRPRGRGGDGPHAPRGSGAGRRADRGRVAGGGPGCVGAPLAARNAAEGGDGGADQPCLVRGAAPGAGGGGRPAVIRPRRGGRLVGGGAHPAAARPAAAVVADGCRRHDRGEPGGRVAVPPGRPSVPARQPVGWRGLVPRRVVRRAPGLGGPPGGDRRAGRALGRGLGRALGVAGRAWARIEAAVAAAGYRVDRLRAELAPVAVQGAVVKRPVTRPSRRRAGTGEPALGVPAAAAFEELERTAAPEPELMDEPGAAEEPESEPATEVSARPGAPSDARPKRKPKKKAGGKGKSKSKGKGGRKGV